MSLFPSEKNIRFHAEKDNTQPSLIMIVVADPERASRVYGALIDTYPLKTILLRLKDAGNRQLTIELVKDEAVVGRTTLPYDHGELENFISESSQNYTFVFVPVLVDPSTDQFVLLPPPGGEKPRFLSVLGYEYIL
jgi:hypothetical protein